MNKEDAERLAKEATEKRFKNRLATADQKNGYEVGYFEALMLFVHPTEEPSYVPSSTAEVAEALGVEQPYSAAGDLDSPAPNRFDPSKRGFQP